MASEYLQGTTRQRPLLVSINSGVGVATASGVTTSTGLALALAEALFRLQTAVKADTTATSNKAMTKSSFRIQDDSTRGLCIP